ncbi:hypothetical protein F4859DRAFT_509980 [Xylaria cf. heliscus]|nr:hypothetical protein F4859DRAFT_509980 [Xylaria cf. heliscus]
MVDIGPELVIRPLEPDWLPWLAKEFVAEEMPAELAILFAGVVKLPPLLVTEDGVVVMIDKFVNVRLPVAETLLSDMLLIDPGGKVMFDDTVTDRESVFEPSLAPVLLVNVELNEPFGDIVNTAEAEDVVKLAFRGVELSGIIVAGTDVRDTLDNVPTDSSPELELPLAEILLREKLLVTAEVVDRLGNIKEVSAAELEIPLEDNPSEAELPVIPGTVSVAAVLVNPLEGNMETEEVSLFVTVLSIELVLDTELVEGKEFDVPWLTDEPLNEVKGDIIVDPVNDIGAGDAPALFCGDIELELTGLSEPGDLVAVSGTLGLSTDDPGILPVIAPVAAEVTMVSPGNNVSVVTLPEKVMTVIIGGLGLVNGGIT